MIIFCASLLTAKKIKVITNENKDFNYKKYLECTDALRELFNPSSGTIPQKIASKKAALAMIPTSSNFPSECNTSLCTNGGKYSNLTHCALYSVSPPMSSSDYIICIIIISYY